MLLTERRSDLTSICFKLGRHLYTTLGESLKSFEVEDQSSNVPVFLYDFLKIFAQI